MRIIRFALACAKLSVGSTQAQLALEETRLKEDSGVELYMKHLGSSLPSENVKMF